MNINMHGTEVDGVLNGEQQRAVYLKDRDGNRLNLFFGSIEAIEGVRDALTEMVIESSAGVEV